MAGEAKEVLQREIEQAKKQRQRILISEAELKPISVRAALRPAKFSLNEIEDFYETCFYILSR